MSDAPETDEATIVLDIDIAGHGRVRGKYMRSTSDHNSMFRHAPWAGLVRGAGLAFDPLPARRSARFSKNDRTAFQSDLTKLVLDRDSALLLCQGMEGTDSVAPKSVIGAKSANGEAAHTYCEAD